MPQHMSAPSRVPRIAGVLAVLTVLAGCAEPLPEGAVPQQVSVREPVKSLVARKSIRDLDVNSRCTVVNMISFQGWLNYAETAEDTPDVDTARALLVSERLARFFYDETIDAFTRRGLSGAQARRPSEALGQAYIEAYWGPEGVEESASVRTARVRVLDRDLEYCLSLALGIDA